MPPERLSAQATPDFAAKPSLPSVTADRAREAGQNSAVNRAHSEDRPLPRGEWAESGCAGSQLPTRLSLQFRKLQGESAKLQGKSRLILAQSLSISGR